MDDNTRSLLQPDHWTIGLSDNFLGLSVQESTYLEVKLALAGLLVERRKAASLRVEKSVGKRIFLACMGFRLVPSRADIDRPHGTPVYGNDRRKSPAGRLCPRGRRHSFQVKFVDTNRGWAYIPPQRNLTIPQLLDRTTLIQDPCPYSRLDRIRSTFSSAL